MGTQKHYLSEMDTFEDLQYYVFIIKENSWILFKFLRDFTYSIIVYFVEPATGNYTEEVPPPTLKPYGGRDRNKPVKPFVHEFDTKHKKRPELPKGESFKSNLS